MSTATNMRAALKKYLDDVDATLIELSELEELAQVYSTVMDQNRVIDAEIHNHEQTIAYLHSQRQELYNDYHNAMFEGETARVLEIEGERDNIDEAIENAQQDIEDSRGKLVQLDGEAVKAMLDKLPNVKLPVFSSDYRLGFVKMANHNGLVEQLKTEHDAITTEVANRIKSIREMQQWHRVLPPEPMSDAHRRLVAAMARG